MIILTSSSSLGRFTGSRTSTVIGFDFSNAIYNPVTLFATGQQGAIYDPSDLTTLWQDASGTVPVTKSGDPVRLMKDKSGNGNHALAPSSASRPTYQTDGILHWLQPDGVDDFFDSVKLVPYVGSKFFISTAMANTGGQRYRGLYRFLREGGLPTSATDNYLEDYNDSFSYPLSRYIAQRYPSISVISSETSATPALNTPFTAWFSNSTAGTKSQVIPSQLSPLNLGVKTLASGNATLSLFRGYSGGLMAGRFYGFIWLSDEITDEARDSANAYLAAKAGLTL